jgi:hypothetical protein
MSTRWVEKDINDSKWEHREDRIKQLYLIDGKPLEGPDGVIKTMTRLHNLSKTYYSVFYT